MNSRTHPLPPDHHAKFFHVLIGTSAFLTFQYVLALWRLTTSSGEMANKFSTLARDEYLGFLVLQNLQMLIAYIVLALAAALLVQPFAALWTARSKFQSRRAVILRSLGLTALVHGFFTLRLVDTRPYFLNEAEFGQWHYKALDLIPEAVKPASLLVLFSVLPIAVIAFALLWQIRRRGRPGWTVAAAVCAAILLTAGYRHFRKSSQGSLTATTAGDRPMNVLIIGSDSLRGDRLGLAGYRPARQDGPAAAGVSPVIDALAKESAVFETCYSPIGSTLESGTSLMASQYPHTHGLRHMFPDAPTLAAARERVVPLAKFLRQRGYDTAAIGDWCAGYYELMPLGMEHLSVSSFDTFKIYMSQAVMMAHFVVPLYFDNPLGYRLFPQINSFAQFVTPDVVTNRVKDRLGKVAASRQPFFWHVFYSCNHLPYRSTQPFAGMFADPAYDGIHRHGVVFDPDAFSSSRELEEKLAAASPGDRRQINALYDGATRQFDDCVGHILASLKENGLAENTIVIVTADHGDDLYDPGVTLLHGQGFNAGLQTNHVPLVIRVPGVKPQTFPEIVRLIDVIPTLADLTGVPKSAAWEGRSFAGWLRGDSPEWRPFYGETGFPFMQPKVSGVLRPPLMPMDEMTFIDPACNYQFVVKPSYSEALIAAKQRCLRTRFWKLVCTPAIGGSRHFGLFHLTADPTGQTDVALTRPEVLAPMQAALERWMDQKTESSIAEIFPDGEPQ
ncbi:MAG: sulfatase [Verrucomicrobiota bacterium]